MYEFLVRNIRLLGVFALLICVVTWWIDLAGWVYECVYCRTQRTAIGLVGLLMILPDPRRWWIRFAAVAICFLGASIAVDQLFLVIRNINAGKPFGMLNLVMASGALFALVGQALLLFTPKETSEKPDE
jgi:hypothetical protein